jgi:hypothetical protein
MTEYDNDRRLLPFDPVQAWRSFWFKPTPMYTLGLVRIGFGALAVAWTLSLLPDLYDLFGPNGVAPQQPNRAYQWGVFDVWTGEPALLIGWGVLLVSAIALTVGWHSRLAAVLVFVLILAFQRRDPFVFNAGDVLIRIEALFLALSPCGAALSLDRRRTAGSFWSAQMRAPWPLRLMQVELSIIYLFTVQMKLAGETWPQGTAVSYALRLRDMQILPSPAWVTSNALIINVSTWGTLVLELSLGILVWNPRLRPWVLAAGVVMHLAIMITIAVAFFTFAMYILYLAFVSPDTVQRLPDKLKHATQSLARWRPPDTSATTPTTEASTNRLEAPQSEEPVGITAITNGNESHYSAVQYAKDIDGNVQVEGPRSDLPARRHPADA